MKNTDKIYPLVLLGGGHTHALWIRSWKESWQALANNHPLKKRHFKEQRPLLISEKNTSPYSGMLPGLLAGNYHFDECHIDLDKLCNTSQCEFLQRECINIQKINSDNPLYRLDFSPSKHKHHDSIYCERLSIDIGSQPFSLTLKESPQAQSKFWKIKPISQFYQHWQSLQQQLSELENNKQSLSSECIRIIGAGAAGVEIACAIKTAYPDCRVQLVSNSDTALPNFNIKMQQRCLRQLKKMNIEFLANNPLTFEELNQSHNILCTHSAAPGWLANTSLELSDNGFIKIDQNLQTSLPGVFAVGDCAHFSTQPLAKAGVYAVRQAPVLFQNICALFDNKPLQRYQPQSQFLSIINMGPRYALAQRGNFSGGGCLVWHYKQYLDQHFMAQFR